jgi:excisionase family DNA binding protein
MEEKRLLRVGEVAERLGLSKSLTYTLIMSGQIKSLTINSARRCTVDAVDEFVRRREEEAEQAAR